MNAFLYSQRGGSITAAGALLLGAIVVVALLPARPRDAGTEGSHRLEEPDTVNRHG